MKASELRDKTAEDLNTELLSLLSDQFKYRMQNSSGQLGQVHLIGQVRKDIARIRTVLCEKTKAGE